MRREPEGDEALQRNVEVDACFKDLQDELNTMGKAINDERV